MGESRRTLTAHPHPHVTLVFNDELFVLRTNALGARNDRERCAIAGISRASLHRWRRGSVVPSLTALQATAHRLNVDLNQLVREVGQ